MRIMVLDWRGNLFRFKVNVASNKVPNKVAIN